MLNLKTADRHDEAAAAAHVLRNRARQPYALVAWTELCQRRQRREKAQDSQPDTCVPTRSTAAPQHHHSTTNVARER